MHLTDLDGLVTGSLRPQLAGAGVADLLSFWQMSAAERSGFLSVLREIRPDAAIEIGTAQGGSLAVVSQHARSVHSLDIDPECERKLKGRFPKVTFMCGPSQVNIPTALEQLAQEKRDLQFVLIDGDHSREGVKRDIELVLRYRPRKPLAILLHDSFNPFCRYGMRDADWTANPFVHEVELDFVPGSSLGVTGKPLEMWGGLGAALLLPEPRTGSLVVGERNRLLFEETMPKSAHAGYFGFGSSGSSSATGRLSSYTYFAGFSDDALRGYLVGEDSPALGHEPAGFLQIRHRLGRQIPEWRLKKRRVAIYGTGEHTRALFGLLPELYSIVACFIDRRGGAEFLGRPCVEPGGFSDALADVVVYSSRAFEHEMRAALASHPVEHVLLYS